MIKARAHREQQTASAPTHADYVEKEPKRSIWRPVGFLLFVMGCVAFIKSCIPFSSGHQKEEDADHAPKQDDTAAAPVPETTAKDPAVADVTDDEPTGTAEHKKHSSNVVPIDRIRVPADELDGPVTPELAPH